LLKKRVELKKKFLAEIKKELGLSRSSLIRPIDFGEIEITNNNVVTEIIVQKIG
jgi:hypothetical protein